MSTPQVKRYTMGFVDTKFDNTRAMVTDGLGEYVLYSDYTVVMEVLNREAMRYNALEAEARKLRKVAEMVLRIQNCDRNRRQAWMDIDYLSDLARSALSGKEMHANT